MISLAKCKILYLLFVSVTSLYFDCRKIEHECLHEGNCNLATGVCACEVPYQGHNCGVSTDTIVNSTDCNPACENNGICNSSSTCICPDTVYGSTCANDRGSVTCSGDALAIKIVPYGQFSGLVYMRKNRTDPPCVFTSNVNPNSGETIYEINLSYTSDCSMKVTQNNSNIMDVTYSTEVVIQIYEQFETSLDIIAHASCRANTEIGTFTVKKRSEINRLYNVTTYHQPVKLIVQTAQGKSFNSPLKIGTPMRLYFSLLDKIKYDALIVQSCDAVEGSNPSTRENIINYGCPTQAGKGIVSGDIIYNMSAPAAIVYFKAFRFPDSSVVSFSCNIQICNSTCQKPVCEGPLRKKRNALTTEVITLNQTLAVVNPSENKDKPTEQPLDSHTQDLPDKKPNTSDASRYHDLLKCLQSPRILMLVVILSVSVVILLAVIFGLTVKLIKSRKITVKVSEKHPSPMTVQEWLEFRGHKIREI
ncbi:EGF-like domain-containing protein 2 [Patella vulgata]|uniref:EGF-like domain-containing protein 2 n=1 Tax=Patella vulgata TaxID=6465 RepID=UPI0024A94B15|nr:EGF-like domain-containing protein 2 [Patella vulgata]